MKAEKFEEIWSGDNAEKTWTHRFLAKPKTIATGGLGVAESPPGRCLGEDVGAKPQNIFLI